MVKEEAYAKVKGSERVLDLLILIPAIFDYVVVSAATVARTYAGIVGYVRNRPPILKLFIYVANLHFCPIWITIHVNPVESSLVYAA